MRFFLLVVAVLSSHVMGDTSAVSLKASSPEELRRILDILERENTNGSLSWEVSEKKETEPPPYDVMKAISWIPDGQMLLVHSPLNKSRVQCSEICDFCQIFFQMTMRSVLPGRITIKLDEYLVMKSNFVGGGLKELEFYVPEYGILEGGDHSASFEISTEDKTEVYVQHFSVAMVHSEDSRYRRKNLITFATDQLSHASRRLAESAFRPGGFDSVKILRPSDIDIEYMTKFQSILCRQRGWGYWLWKPYFINRTLHEMEEGDILMYADAGLLFEKEAEPLFQLLEKDPFGVMTFDQSHYKEYEYTKRDVFVILDADSPEFTHTTQRYGSYSLYRVSNFAKEFAAAVLIAAQDQQMLLDEPNEQGLENYEGFFDHRHEQSILSVLAKKWGLINYKDATQQSKHVPAYWTTGDYDQIMYHHRWRNKAFTIFDGHLAPQHSGGADIFPY